MVRNTTHLSKPHSSAWRVWVCSSYYSQELRPRQGESLLTGEIPGAPEVSPHAGWGPLPEGGPALGLRRRLFLSCGSRAPHWEGRNAGLVVDQELGG